MGHSAKILADSVSPAGHRLTTFEVTFPRIVLAEFNTHRMFSRNSASSRAIPVKKMLERVKNDPFVPSYWGKNQKGMQAAEQISQEDRDAADFAWLELRNHAMNTAHYLAFPEEEGCLNIHKQTANRLLEPWCWHTVIVTATEWSNFFNLRDNPKAAPEIQEGAHMMQELYQGSIPRSLKEGQWHLPLIDEDELKSWADSVGAHEEMTEKQFDQEVVKICAARCARISYLTHDGKRDPSEDLRLYNDLVQPGHMSPLEHPARPMTEEELELFKQKEYVWGESSKKWVWTGRYTHFLGNLNGWVQHRKQIPGEWNILGYRRTT